MKVGIIGAGTMGAGIAQALDVYKRQYLYCSFNPNSLYCWYNRHFTIPPIINIIMFALYFYNIIIEYKNQ